MSYFVLADEKVNLLTTKTTTPTTSIQQHTPNAPSSEKNASSNSGEKPATKTATVAPAEPEKHEHDSSEQHGRSKREGKPAAKARGMRKPSKPSTVDCDKHHSVRAQDDNNLRGVLVVKSCHAARFVRKPSRVTNVANKFQSLLADHLNSRGVKGRFPWQISKVLGNSTHTEFHYTVPCAKSHHETVIASLKTACKEAAFIGTITQENQPHDDDSSSARWSSGAREDGSYGSNESGEHELKLSHSPKHSHESRKHSPSTITRATTGAGHAVSQMITTVKDASSTQFVGDWLALNLENKKHISIGLEVLTIKSKPIRICYFLKKQIINLNLKWSSL
ncbi:unnamed protein product [Rotaria socialis]|uniref:Uncharacterized protein n=1 Tax=Rotaria socialis TaxID=392032 RepID=A0A820SR80_9BILA|nr:unnamed protein product [Rotaria socialis]